MSRPAGPWQRVIGIVGGLGPHAHLQLERAILDEVRAARDQDYPEWILTSMPQTPDRTAALEGRGESPAPFLEQAIERLATRADFAVIACVTAHAFLPQLRPRIPVLGIVEETIHSAREAGRSRIGILATDGTLASRVFETTAARVAAGLELVSPIDLGREGERLQEECVMAPIYRGVDGAASIKAGGAAEPGPRRRLAGALEKAARLLIGHGAQAIVLGCTEIPLALGDEPIDGVPLIDPLRVTARAAVEIARGERPLPAG